MLYWDLNLNFGCVDGEMLPSSYELNAKGSGELGFGNFVILG